MRIACLRVPDFPLQALRRSAPDLAEARLAIAAGPLPRDAIVAVSAEAAELGVRAGMTAAQARHVAPGVQVRVTPEAVAAAADEALADVASGFSPRVKRWLPGEVLLDVGGLAPRFGSEGAVAHELLRACRHVGLEARVGIASNLGVARVAARCAEEAGPVAGGRWPATTERSTEVGVFRSGRPPGGRHSFRVAMAHTAGQRPAATEEHDAAPRGVSEHGAYDVACSESDAAAARKENVGVGLAPARESDCDVVVVRSGEERTFMAPQPLALLEPEPEIAATLVRWGLTKAGDLARLTRHEVGLRLGPGGVALHRLACGEEAEAFVPDPIREVLREGVELDFPLATLEPFMFVANGILARLARRLELRGEGFAGVLLELHLEGAGHREVRFSLVAPTRDVPAVLSLARLQLEAHPPGAPVEGVTALVTPGRVRLAQGSLFGAPMPAPGKLSTTLARLAALVGPERVGAPAVGDTHRPGVWRLAPFSLPEGNAAEGQRSGGAGGRGQFEGSKVRRFEGPARTVKSEELRVKSCELPDTTTCRRSEGSTAAGKRENGKGKREDEETGSKVRRFEGPATTPADSVARTTDHGPPATSLVSPATGHRPPATPHPVLKAFRPPRAARVDAVNGRPVVVWVDTLGGIVVGWAGPYRFVGDWWGDEPFAREDFDVATTDGSLLRVHFDRLERRWFADGFYD